jgi:hypothetical protein
MVRSKDQPMRMFKVDCKLMFSVPAQLMPAGGWSMGDTRQAIRISEYGHSAHD